MDREGG